MRGLSFRLEIVSDFITRMATHRVTLVTHKRADPDAMASILFVRLLAMQRHGVELDFTIDASSALIKRIPHLFEQKGEVLGFPVLKRVTEDKVLCLLDTCDPRMAFLPSDGGNQPEIMGSLDHHTTMENPVGLNLYLPASSMSVVFAELGFALFPPDHAIWTSRDWQYLAATLAIGIVSDAGFTTPNEYCHIWNLSKLPLASEKDISILHDLVKICPRSVLKEFEAAQVDILSGLQGEMLRKVNDHVEIFNFGDLAEDQRDMVGAHLDCYMASQTGLVGVVGLYSDGNNLRYSARVRACCSLLPQLTTALCGNRGSVKNNGQQAGGTVMKGVQVGEAALLCKVVGEDLVCSHARCGLCDTPRK